MNDPLSSRAGIGPEQLAQRAKAEQIKLEKTELARLTSEARLAKARLFGRHWTPLDVKMAGAETRPLLEKALAAQDASWASEVPDLTSADLAALEPKKRQELIDLARSLGLPAAEQALLTSVPKVKRGLFTRLVRRVLLNAADKLKS